VAADVVVQAHRDRAGGGGHIEVPEQAVDRAGAAGGEGEGLRRARWIADSGSVTSCSCAGPNYSNVPGHWLILVVGMSMAAFPALLDTRALRLRGRETRAWKAIVQAALQSAAGVLAFVVVPWLILETLRADVRQIGNAVFPQPGDWHPGVLEALLLSAVLPGIIEELVFR